MQRCRQGRRGKERNVREGGSDVFGVCRRGVWGVWGAVGELNCDDAVPMIAV